MPPAQSSLRGKAGFKGNSLPLPHLPPDILSRHTHRAGAKNGCYLIFQKAKVTIRNIRKPQLIIHSLAVPSSVGVSESEFPHVTVDFIVGARNANAVL